MSPSSPLLRLTLLLYALVLGAASLWILAAELSRSGARALPTSPEQAANAATHRGDALRAARLGAVRGELWAEAAFTDADLLWPDAADREAGAREEAKASAMRALSQAPERSGAWLLLAGLALRYGWQTPEAAETLKMAYYTGPREDALVPLRLMVAARLDVAADVELGRLFRRDLETILTYRPALQPAIVAAYGQATPQARQAIEDTAGRIDPAFAAALQAGSAR